MERENTKMELGLEDTRDGSTQGANKASSLPENDKKEGGEEVGKVNSLRVNQLSRFLRHQQEVVYK